MTVNNHFASSTAPWRGLRAALLTGLAALLVAGCGGDSKCPDEPPFEGVQVGECSESANGGTATPVAADLSLTLTVNGVAATTLPNDGRSTITATVTAVDSNRNVLPNIPVTISVDNDATAATSGTTTNDAGIVLADVGIGNNRSNRTVTVTASSGGLARTSTFQVVGASLAGTPLPDPIPPGGAGRVDFQLLDVNKAPMSGQTIVVTGSDGTNVSGTTDGSGSYTYNYTAPSAAGTINISATAGGSSTTRSIQVQSGTGGIPSASIAVQSASVSASPSVVPVNSTGTNNRSEVRALFVGANNAAIKNVRVRFDLGGDANGIGGSFTTGDNVVYTDANGVATTAYVPGTRSSPTDGVTVRACYAPDDFPAGTCPSQATTTLTVVSDTVSVSIGTDALIEVSGQSYVKRYVVQVVDSSGLAKGGVQISPSVDLLQYQKGYWEVTGIGTARKWSQFVEATCDNEDLNRNAVLQVYSNGIVEDANGSLTLEPRKADVAISFVGSSTTNSDGQVVLKITYPQSVASWVGFNIQVAASGIAGTEGRTNFSGILPVLSSAVSSVDVEPAFRLSPYGVEPSATELRINPLGQSGNLCTNPN